MTQVLSKHTLEKAASFVTLLTVFLTPLIFNPYTVDLFDLNKHVFLGISTLTLMSIWMIQSIHTKTFRITLSPFTGPLILYVGVIFLSSFTLNFPRLIESFINITGAFIFLALFFIAASTLKHTSKFSEKILYALVASAVALSLLAILESSQFGPGKIISQVTKTTYDAQIFVTPAGSVVSLIFFLLPMLITCFVLAITKKSPQIKIPLFIAAASITAAMVISVFMMLPGKPNAPLFLPFETSWLIAVENIKSPKSFLLGSGADDYVYAFNRNRGVSFNQYEFWNTRFTTAHNYPLTLFTSSGLVGLLSWLLLLFYISKTALSRHRLSLNAKLCLMGLGLVILTIFIIPNNIVLTSLFFFLLLALVVELKDSKDPVISELLLKVFAAKLVDSADYDPRGQNNLKAEILPLLVGIPTIILALLVYYGSYRVLAADIYFQKSLVATAANDGRRAYDNQQLAINLNPFNSTYHQTYAATNLALANAIGSQENISDADRETVTTLIRQSIRSSQNAIRINPRHPANWENMATVYTSLIGVADDSQQWALSSYAEAINIDPTNPRLWINAGGVFYQIENYSQAIDIFTRAVQLKPDWPNGHYNLANAYVQNKELERAVNQYELLLQLIDQTNSDYAKALEEQNAIKRQLGLSEATVQPESTQLQLPAQPTDTLENAADVDLTEEDAPPTTNSGFSQLTTDPEATPSGTE